MDTSSREETSASTQPQSHDLWLHARTVRGTTEALREEFALLLEESALTLAEATLFQEDVQHLRAKAQ